MLLIRGLDYAFGRPNPGRLYAAGYRFVNRYLSHDPSKNLDGVGGKDFPTGEKTALLNAQLDIVLNWESTADRALGGAPNGTADGQTAAQQVKALNAPLRAAIYFSVDTDVSPAQFPTIGAYFDAARRELGGRRIGAYGERDLIEWLLEHGHIDFAWQTNALGWDPSGEPSPKAVIVQHLPTTVDGVEVDTDVALAAEYGGWRAPAPQPSPSDLPIEVLAASGGSDVFIAYQIPNQNQITAVGLGVKWNVPDRNTFDKMVTDGLLRVQPDGHPFPASPQYLAHFRLIAAP